MKLNLGCGSNFLPGHENVDKFFNNIPHIDAANFTLCNLVATSYDGMDFQPWIWRDVTDVKFIHSLEHMGETVAEFRHILTQLYRACAPAATILIVVPHPRHDDYLNDPTHVRPITPELCQLFSKRLNREWQEKGVSNSQLALAWDIDFEMVECNATLDPEVEKSLEGLSEDQRLAQIHQITKALNNTIKEYHITLKVIK